MSFSIHAKCVCDHITVIHVDNQIRLNYFKKKQWPIITINIKHHWNTKKGAIITQLLQSQFELSLLILDETEPHTDNLQVLSYHTLGVGAQKDVQVQDPSNWHPGEGRRGLQGHLLCKKYHKENIDMIYILYTWESGCTIMLSYFTTRCDIDQSLQAISVSTLAWHQKVHPDVWFRW